MFTIGHSTRELEEFVDLLHHHGVELVVDVRTIPASRRLPHFGKVALERSLPDQSISYLHMPELGGLRKPRPGSVNTGLRNLGFRGYADHMQGVGFWTALENLEELAAARPTAIMCAEAVPWRCHRSLLSDALAAKRVEVLHITGKSQPAVHAISPFALVDAGRITYPGPNTLPL
ncbi:MAG: DUF488 domain-containing protein [Candidatus Dormibacteraceae bacterium]